MDVVIKVLAVVYVVILAVQLQGFLSHRRKPVPAPEELEYAGAAEGEASFS